MDLLIRTETEKKAKKDVEEFRKLRIMQVRQQSSTWMSNTRRKYKAEKSEKLQEVIDEAVSKRKDQFQEAIKEMTNSHLEGMHQIGAAHRAAELFNQMDFPKQEQAQKIQDDKAAVKRHYEALKTKWAQDTKENESKLRAQRLKDEVRKNEDMIAKALVHVRPYQVPPIGDSSAKARIRRDPLSPIKYLHVPGAEKSTKKKQSKSKSGPSPAILKENKKPTRTMPDVFGIVANERAAGAAPQIVRQHVQASRLKQTHATKDFQKGDYAHAHGPQVTFLDASIPLPPIHYRAPAGLAQRVSRESVRSNAWVDGERMNEEAQRVEAQIMQDTREIGMRAKARGQKALKIAQLDQRYKQLEADLLDDNNQVQGFQPVLDSSNRNSFLGLGDPEVEDDTDKTPLKDPRTRDVRSLPLRKTDQLDNVAQQLHSSKTTSKTGTHIHFLDDESEDDSENVQLLEIKQKRQTHKLKLKHSASPELITQAEEGTAPALNHRDDRNLHERRRLDLRRLATEESSSSSLSTSTSCTRARLSSIDENTESYIYTLSSLSTPTPNGSSARELESGNTANASAPGPRMRAIATGPSVRSSNESSSSSSSSWDHRLNISRSFTMHSTATVSGFFSSTPERPYSTTQNNVGKYYMQRVLEMRRESVETLAITSGSSISTDDSTRLIINSSACTTLTSSSSSQPNESEYSPPKGQNHSLRPVNLRGPSEQGGGGDNFKNSWAFDQVEEFGGYELEKDDESVEEDEEAEAEFEDDDSDEPEEEYESDEASSSSTSTMAVLGVVCSPRRQRVISPAESNSSLADALSNLCIQQENSQRTSAARQQRTSSPPTTNSESIGTSTILNQARRQLDVDRENLNPLPRLESPSGCSSIRSRSSVSSNSSSRSKEANRGAFGTNLGNTIFSSSVQSEQQQHTGELTSASSGIRKLTNEWSRISIERPP